MGKWIPDRKVLAGGLAAVLAWLVTVALAGWGVSIPTEVVGGAVAGAYALIAYLVPPSVGDLLKRADDTLKALGKDSSDTAGA